MDLLQRTFIQPVTTLGNAALHEIGEITHPLVHAVEQPINNVIRDSQQIVGGLYQLTQAAFHLAPYYVGGWLVWTAFSTYFPGEKRSLEGALYSAAQRMRLR